MIVNINQPVERNAKTLELCLKVSDMFDCCLRDENGDELKDYSGYVPDFMPGEHYGDYVMLTIDIDSGQITNWKAPTPSQIEEFILSGNG